jgi:hypothetical protein
MRKAAVLAAILASTAAWAAGGNDKSYGATHRSSSTTAGTGSAQMNANEANAPGSVERDRLSKDDFDLKGKVGRVSAKSVTIERDKSTPATLMIDQATKIEVDGKPARATDLKPGDDVKASFNLSGERPIAVDLKASAKK